MFIKTIWIFISLHFHIAHLYLCVCGLNWWWLKSCTRSMMCKIAWSTKCQQYFPLDIQMISCFLFMSYFLKWSFRHKYLRRQKIILYYEFQALNINSQLIWENHLLHLFCFIIHHLNIKRWICRVYCLILFFKSP